MLRLETKCLLIRRYRIVQTSQVEQGQSETIARVQVSRLELESARKPRGGIVVATRVHVQTSKLGADGGIVRILLRACFEPFDLVPVERFVSRLAFETD